MEYRGAEYSVVRTIAKSWRWSVKKDRTEKIGQRSGVKSRFSVRFGLGRT